MYQQVRSPRVAPRTPEPSSRLGAEAVARSALARVRKLLGAYLPGMHFEPAALASRLTNALTDPAPEAERAFARGWLHWLAGEFETAAPLFDDAVTRARSLEGTSHLAEAAYWRARVGLLLEAPDALTNFESLLRTLGGSAQATTWFVDLLWRAGRIDRAEQVWRGVRGNRKVTACEEGPLLEARSALRRGEIASALKTLDEAAPAGGVVQVERLLLGAWALAEQKQFERALATWQEAASGPYPATALRAWREHLERRMSGGGTTVEVPAAVPPPLRDLIRGHLARVSERTDEAVAAYRAALAAPAAQPFARYALASLGLEDPSAVLLAQPGLFLAVRARLWAARERFRRREASPAEFLAAIQQAASQHYTAHAAVEPFRTLAAALEGHDLGSLEALLNASQGEPAARRNALRALAELVFHDLPPRQAVERLLTLARGEENVDFRASIGRLALGLLLRARAAGGGSGEMPEGLAELLPGEPLLALLGPPVATGGPPVAGASTGGPPVTTTCATAPFVHGLSEDEAPPAIRLARLAAELANGEKSESVPTEPDLARWRERVRTAGEGSLRSLALALLVQEAGRRHDAEAVLALLADLEAWQRFRPTPPAFAVRAVAAAAAAHPNHPGWRVVLPPWLATWGVAALGGVGTALAGLAGIPVVDALQEAPPGTAPVPWFLHRAARALEHDDPGSALACVRRALDVDPDLTTVPSASSVRAALPELERRARAQALAVGLRPMGSPALSSALLVDVVDLLLGLPDGALLLDSPVPREILAERTDLPPRLAHHLALADTRAALFLEGQGDHPDDAVACWRRAWDHWLRFLAGPDVPGGAAVLADHLLDLHRRRLTALLARADVDEARGTWQRLVQALPERAAELAPSLADLLGERVARWRDDLATEFLLATREAMRFGDVPEGLHADYEKGLAALRRHLSLDHDNVRLLTALVEICTDWFLDLYNAPDVGDLAEVVGRFTPLAQQLARLSEGRPGDLPARAVLADFWKFRGFVTHDRARKRALYEEALQFNPGNSNVRELLASLEKEE